MKNLFGLIAIIAVLLSGAVKSYAAFPAQTQCAVAMQALPAEGQQIASADMMKTYTPPVPAPRTTAGDEMGLIFGILALVFGILSVLVSPIGAIIFGAAAIILGIMGMHRPYRGLSIAGLVLGIVGAVVGLARIAAD
jgi:hypothetical protein